MRDNRGGGYHELWSKLFGLTVPKSFVKNPSWFQKNSGIENFYGWAGRGEYHNFPSKFFGITVQSTEKFRRGTLLCFRNFQVSKNVTDNRGGGYHDFSSKLFGLTVPKSFVEKHFLVSEKLWYRNFSCIRGGRVSRFSVVILKFKILGKGWDSNPYVPLPNPVVLPTVPWEPVEFLTNVSKMIKLFGSTETRAQNYCLRTLLS